MFVKTITIYCSYIDNKELKYARRVVNGVFIDKQKVVNTNTTGMTDTNSVFIAIPKSVVPNYVSPKVFNVNPSDKITFKEGDIIVEGEIKTDYNSMTTLQKELDNVYTITGIDYKDFGTMPHFEISGK